MSFETSTKESPSYLGELPVANLEEAVAKDDDVEDNVRDATPEAKKKGVRALNMIIVKGRTT